MIGPTKICVTLVIAMCATCKVTTSLPIDAYYAESDGVSFREIEQTKLDSCDNDTYFPHECSAVHFYRCIEGKKVRMRCPDGTYFDSENLICNWPPHGHCRVYFSEDCTYTSVYFPDKDDPTNFYQCDNGVFYKFKCPNELEFNKELNVCDWPYNVKNNKGDKSEDEWKDLTSTATKYPNENREIDEKWRNNWTPVVGSVPNEYNNFANTQNWNSARPVYPTSIRWPSDSENSWRPQQNVLQAVTNTMTTERTYDKSNSNCTTAPISERRTNYNRPSQNSYSPIIIFPEDRIASKSDKNEVIYDTGNSNVRIQSPQSQTDASKTKIVNIDGDSSVISATVTMYAGMFDIGRNNSDFFIYFRPNANFRRGSTEVRVDFNKESETKSDLFADLRIQDESTRVIFRSSNK